MKKTLAAIAILVCMLTGMLGALAETADAPKGSEPFGDGKTLSLACLEGWYSAVTVNDNLPAWQKIEENTGVKI